MNTSIPFSSSIPIKVIGIVASLGGVEAVQHVLANLPADFPVPILLLQHLGEQSTVLVTVLSRKSPLRIRWAAEGDVLEPATVWVVPPGFSLHTYPDGTISLVPASEVVKSGYSAKGWPSADQFLTSIAFSYGPGALVVVLTGMGEHGARGVREVKQQGGMILAQDEATSLNWGMPKAAIETGCVDLIVPLHEIAPVLVGIVKKGTGLPRSPQELQVSEALFSGGGAAGTVLHRMDWSQTPLGRVRDWGSTLAAATRIMLASPQPLAVLWGAELILLYNDACSPLLGDAHPQALGQPLRESWQEGAEVLFPLIDQVRSAGRAVERVDQPFCIRRYGLREEDFATYAVSPIRDEHGDVGGFLLTMRQTTDQHTSERRLRTLQELGSSKAFASSPEDAYEAAALVLSDNRTDLPFALLYRFDELRQHAFLAGLSGLPDGGPASPQTIDLDRQSPGFWPLEQVASMGKAVRVENLSDRAAFPADAGFPENASAAFLLPLRTSPDGPPTGCAVLGATVRSLLDPAYRDFLDLVARQIAQNVQAGQQIEEARQKAQAFAELDRVRTEFFNNISHEFRTPLTLLLGPLEDLLAGTRGQLVPPQQAAVELAHRNSLRLLKQVNTLLDFSRLEAGRMQARLEPIDLAALTVELAEGFRPAIERAGLHLFIECPPLPEPVLADGEMWEKIVLNLLSNALKFTFAGSITVRLRALPNHVELTVRDSGVGIAPEHLPHLFTRFYRVPGGRARTREGSGIGLALVHELVHLHGGAVRVQSQPEQGSTFTIWLPRRIRPLPRKPVDQPLLSTATGVMPFLQEANQWIEGRVDQLADELLPSVEPLSARSPGARVLVADDNADMRDYLHQLLGHYWTVETVADGEQALLALERELPDVLLADVMMPRIDGFALLHMIRERPAIATLPIILVTARAGEETAIEGLLAGADDAIIKPFSARELVARVGAQLELARLRRESRAAIERSEAFLRTAVEASGVGVWELDVRTRQYTLSERVYELLDIEADGEDVSTAMAAHVHPEDRERLNQAQAQALDPQGDGRYQVEYRVRHKSGRLLWLDSRGRANFQEREDGRHPIVLRGAILDVSEQKHLLEVVRQAPDFIGVCGPDLMLVFLNEAGKRLIGRQGVDVSQMSIPDCFSQEEQVRIREEVLPQAMREGLWRGELYLRRHGLSSLMPVDCHMYANYADDGRFVGLAIIATDISERKRAEAIQVHFRALFESAPGLYLVLEPEEFRIVAVSDAYLRATMTEREEIMGKVLFEVFPDDPNEPWADGVRNLRTSLERVRSEKRADVMAVQRYPVRRPMPEGGAFVERWWSPINSPVLGLDGEMAYIIHRVEDVTPFMREMQEQGREADGLHQLESRAQHMEAEIVLRAQELQRVNEQLRESEERYRRLLQARSSS